MTQVRGRAHGTALDGATHRYQVVGGVAALVEAATFVIGFAMFATLLADYTADGIGSRESAAFVAEHHDALYVWYSIIFLAFGLALIPLVLALHERTEARGRLLARAATAFGVIWSGLVLAAGMIALIGLGTVTDLYETDPAEAATVWSALDAVQDGLGGGNELVGAAWLLLLSLASWRGRALPVGLNALGVSIAVAGVATIVPALDVAGAVFGLGLIVWFVWTGVVLCRTTSLVAPGDGAGREVLDR